MPSRFKAYGQLATYEPLINVLVISVDENPNIKRDVVNEFEHFILKYVGDLNVKIPFILLIVITTV